MTLITERANTTYRDYEIDGVSSSGAHEPEKPEARELYALIDIAFATLGVNGAITVKKATRDLLDDDLAHAADSLAVVYNDPIPALNGIYAKVGGSGSGEWLITALALPASFAADLADALAQMTTIEAILGYVEADRVEVLAYRNQTLTARNEAVTARTAAQAARDEALALAELTGGPFEPFRTKAEANAALAGLPEGDWVQVLVDESEAGSRTVYQKVAGVYSAAIILDYITPSSADTLTNKIISGTTPFILNGGRIGITSGATALPAVEGVVHIKNDDSVGVGLLVESYWSGQASDPYTNNDSTLFITYNKTVDTSFNRSWSASICNAYHDIPVGVTDNGERIGSISWATSVAYPGYSLAGTLDSAYGAQGAVGFQGVGSGTGTILSAVALRGLVYADSPGDTINFATAGGFFSDGLGLDGTVGTASTILNNVAVYARARNGTVTNNSFFGEFGKLFNADQISGGSEYSQSDPAFAARVVPNAYEWGILDGSGYGSTLGATSSLGKPFMMLCGEGEPAAETFRTRGIKGVGVTTNLTGSLIFVRLANANAAGQTPTESGRFDANSHFLPGADGAQNLGSADVRWATVFASTGTINTSDERMKTEISEIPDSWLDAWGTVAWSRFRFKEGRRWHTGLVAQRVHAAFAEAGIDAFEIGLCCYDEWPEQTEPVMGEVTRIRQVRKTTPERFMTTQTMRTKGGEVLEVEVPDVRFTTEMVDEEYMAYAPTGEERVVRAAGNAWGLRYEECFALEAAWHRRELARASAADSRLAA